MGLLPGLEKLILLYSVAFPRSLSSSILGEGNNTLKRDIANRKIYKTKLKVLGLGGAVVFHPTSSAPKGVVDSTYVKKLYHKNYLVLLKFDGSVFILVQFREIKFL